jgi:hypothetical protein
MADVTANTHLMYQSGDCERTILLSVRNTTAGDTLDVYNWLSVVKKAGLVSDTGTTIASIATPANGAKGTPTLLTIPAGPAADAVWIIAQGAAA